MKLFIHFRTSAASSLFLSFCRATQEEIYAVQTQEHEYLLSQGINETNITAVPVDTHQYLAIYSGFVVSVFVFGLVRALLTFYLLVRAAAHLHDDMFAAIIRCPMLFFDTNISGKASWQSWEAEKWILRKLVEILHKQLALYLVMAWYPKVLGHLQGQWWPEIKHSWPPSQGRSFPTGL